MRRLGTILMVVAALAAFGCGGRRAPAERSAAAPEAAAGGKKAVIAVYLDRNIDKSMTADQVTQRNQLGDWMERDLVSQLSRARYETRVVRKPGDFVPAGGSYLLTVKIVRYNPGSKAARIVIGYGAGSTSLDIRYELSAGSGKSLVAKETGVASSIEWTRAARKLNQDTVRAVSEKLR